MTTILDVENIPNYASYAGGLFGAQKVPSTFGYHSGYERPMGLVGQCRVLMDAFPGLGSANGALLAQIEDGKAKLWPQYIEGGFAVPNIWKPNGLSIFGTTYSEALLMMFRAISRVCGGKFDNYRDGQINEEQLRQSALALDVCTRLSEAQGYPDILIILAQFGIRHRGLSVYAATETIKKTPGEFPLGTFAIGAMILTHRLQRLAHYNDLGVDAGGDRFDHLDSPVRFDHTPFFIIDAGEIKVGAARIYYASDKHGMMTGYAPIAA